MTFQSATRNPSADQAKAAFADYATLVRLHANVPALWDAPERVQARRDAHERFLAAFGGAL